MESIKVNSQSFLTPLQEAKKVSTGDLQRIKESVDSDVSKVSFAETLQKAVHKVDTLQKIADKKVQELSTGKTTNIPEVMIAVEKADIALKLMVQVRNKVIDAYQEVMKMQV